MKIITIVMTAASLLSLSAPAALYAQTAAPSSSPTPGIYVPEIGQHGWEFLLNELGRELGISASQRDSIRPVVVQTNSQIYALRQSEHQQEKADALAAIAQIRTVLTPAQQTRMTNIVNAFESLQAAQQALQTTLQP